MSKILQVCLPCGLLFCDQVLLPVVDCFRAVHEPRPSDVMMMSQPNPPTSQLDEQKRVYRRYIDLLNAQDFTSLTEVVDPGQYKEICVGFTPGWVNLPDAISSLKKVLLGIPDLHAHIEDIVSEDNKVYARLRVSGTQRGRLFGIPATNKRYEVQMFDYALMENGKIVERIQQSDNLGQFMTLFKSWFVTLVSALLILILGLVIGLLVK